MKNLLLILIFAGLFWGCRPISGVINETANGTAHTTMDYSFLALGDSYTIGEGVLHSERWPVQLVEELNFRGHRVAPPKIIAETGWTTRNLLIAMENELHDSREFDLVSVLIGVNNQYQNRTLEEYEEELNEIFSYAIEKSKRREAGVFALSIPDYGATPFGASDAAVIRKELDQFNRVYRRVAEEYGVDFYNITPISRDAERDPDLIAGDSLHPSGKMYRFWMLEIVDEVESKLPD